MLSAFVLGDNEIVSLGISDARSEKGAATQRVPRAPRQPKQGGPRMETKAEESKGPDTEDAVKSSRPLPAIPRSAAE